ncbi:hypothetical protein HBI80_081810 [Parastagonospora nodorum]|nr:hypothetical protein HBI80_081810 [Parastagonospora nodorum]KAH4936029.1 hypothetical protein HBI79_075790 [Parastagonospora nodorum]KAH6063439.1 hypothetical protein HBI67_140090 [Parastagonospora nodorum]KAH6066419.1 hypothetical protein HBI66_157870 [Parastagonospora nodorum]
MNSRRRSATRAYANKSVKVLLGCRSTYRERIRLLFLARFNNLMFFLNILVDLLDRSKRLHGIRRTQRRFVLLILISIDNNHSPTLELPETLSIRRSANVEPLDLLLLDLLFIDHTSAITKLLYNRPDTRSPRPLHPLFLISLPTIFPQTSTPPHSLPSLVNPKHSPSTLSPR